MATTPHPRASLAPLAEDCSAGRRRNQLKIRPPNLRHLAVGADLARLHDEQGEARTQDAEICSNRVRRVRELDGHQGHMAPSSRAQLGQPLVRSGGQHLVRERGRSRNDERR